MNLLGPEVALHPFGRPTVPVDHAVSLSWDESAADLIVQELLARLRRACPTGWQPTLSESPKWAELEGRIDAAYLVKDIAALVRACRGYAQFVLRCFAAWQRLAEIAGVDDAGPEQRTASG